MRSVLGFKWARDPQDAKVDSGGMVTWRSTKLAVSDDDAAAAEVARGLGGEIIGLTLGEGDVAWAAARGASSTLCVSDTDVEAGGSHSADLLAAGVRRIGGADVVLLGDCAWDRLVAVAVGAKLGWRTLAGVLAAEEREGQLLVSLRRSAGVETMTVQTPVVLAVTARHTEGRPPGMKEVLAARKKPVERVTVAELGVAPALPSQIRGTALPPRPQTQIFTGQDAAEQLASALRSEGVL